MKTVKSLFIGLGILCLNLSAIAQTGQLTQNRPFAYTVTWSAGTVNQPFGPVSSVSLTIEVPAGEIIDQYGPWTFSSWVAYGTQGEDWDYTVSVNPAQTELTLIITRYQGLISGYGLMATGPLITLEDLEGRSGRFLPTAQQWSLQHNPSRDLLIALPETVEHPLSVKAVDVQGRTMARFEVIAGKNRISLPHLPAGSYWLLPEGRSNWSPLRWLKLP
ncbi:MAG: hypothetical protein AAFR61_29210 [Bacteroidota bacterium]